MYNLLAVPEGYSIKPGTMITFASRESVVVLFINMSGQLQALLIKTRFKSLRDPLLIQGEEVSETMKNIKVTLLGFKNMNLLKNLFSSRIFYQIGGEKSYSNL